MPGGGLETHQRSDLLPHDFRRTRFDQVRVAARMKGFVANIGERRYDNDRNAFGPARLTKLLESGPAIDAGHCEIEDDRVGREIGGLVETASAVDRGERDPAFHPQVVGVDPPRIRVIIDDEHRHTVLYRPPLRRRDDGNFSARHRHSIAGATL
jgi:hypothetical protein